MEEDRCTGLQVGAVSRRVGLRRRSSREDCELAFGDAQRENRVSNLRRHSRCCQKSPLLVEGEGGGKRESFADVADELVDLNQIFVSRFHLLYLISHWPCSTTSSSTTLF